jgi:asparagine synthase (glutamine-hydrolysing)
MCGIAGILMRSGQLDLEDAARRMAAALIHRGPDGEGIWTDPAVGIALAHRRLAIIDLSPFGQQPMHSPQGRFVASFNGEIYNFRELRCCLDTEPNPPHWRGHSDTEVLLAAFETWGIEETLRRSVGMFAIAVWDRRDRLLTLARDRLGEKPLYYGNTNAGFVFASELKAVRAVPGLSLQVDRQALAAFMQFGCVPAPECIYSGLSKLPPGHLVVIPAHGEVQEPRAYWTLQDKTAPSGREWIQTGDSELINLVHDQIADAVRSQMNSDVPIGAFLSGGVDSSLIVALMQAQSSRPVRTYTIGFQESEFDEAPFAAAVARHLGTEHVEMRVTADDAKRIIPDLPRIYDEPFADSSQLPTTLVARLTSRQVSVALSGDGGDELFAGYPRYQLTSTAWRRMQRIPAPVRTVLATLIRGPSPSAWNRMLDFLPVSLRGQFNGRRMHRLSTLIESRSLAEVYIRLMSQWLPEAGLVRGLSATKLDTSNWQTGTTSIEELRRWDVGQYLPNDLLVKVDRAAMSASLETRAPLLNHRVVETAFHLPERVLVRGNETKWILRQILDRYIPRALIDRPKAGFSVPLAAWLRGPLRTWAADLLDPTIIRSQGLLDEVKVTQVWNEHATGRMDRSAHLWNLLMFQAWLESGNS